MLKKSGLNLDRTGLWRKLHGHTKFTIEEVGVLAETFRRHGEPIKLVWPSKRSKRAA